MSKRQPNKADMRRLHKAYEEAYNKYEISPISNTEALEYFKKYSAYRGPFNLAIAVREGGVIHGVIAFNANGENFDLGHISTDGSSMVGSLLYGAAWRAAKALGYKRIKI